MNFSPGRFFVAFACCLIFFTAHSQHSIRIGIAGLPSYHVPFADIYLAGSFNAWNPGDSSYRFTQDGKGAYYIELKLPAGRYEFKLTRGNWTSVECHSDGSGISNRLLSVPADTAVSLAVNGWADHFANTVKKSTAGRNVRIIDTAFYIPQLKRTRRIWVCLPEGYASSKRRYPVIYMHDGQNLYDDTTAFAGEWGVDECLDSMKEKSIIVGIDHGGNTRLNEYSPYDLGKYGKGEGALYADFLARTLKPFIDRRYRTLRQSRSTFVAGSSMGGLISMYILLRYPRVFGGAGIFSPSFWIAPGIYADIMKYGKSVKGRIYFYAGKRESEEMVPDLLRALHDMVKVSSSKIVLVIRDQGQHNEASWKAEFPLFYHWILN